MNTFAALEKSNKDIHRVTDARNLALAFLASNDGKDELYACLRLLDKLGGHAGGYYAGYLDGCHFMVDSEDGQKIALAELDGDEWSFHCETFRYEARAFMNA